MELAAKAGQPEPKDGTLMGVINRTPSTFNNRGDLLKWHSVKLGLFPKGCISQEDAQLDGPEGRAQDVSLRLAVVMDCGGVGYDGESHIRAWFGGKRNGINRWYMAISREHMCRLPDGKPWHCIIPPGFKGDHYSVAANSGFYASKLGGYDQGRDDFEADLNGIVKADTYALNVQCAKVARPDANTPETRLALYVPADPAKMSSIEPTYDIVPDTRKGHEGKMIRKRVPWDGNATYCRVTDPHTREKALAAEAAKKK
jgi:hypothetical protein